MSLEKLYQRCDIIDVKKFNNGHGNLSLVFKKGEHTLGTLSNVSLETLLSVCGCTKQVHIDKSENTDFSSTKPEPEVGKQSVYKEVLIDKNEHADSKKPKPIYVKKTDFDSGAVSFKSYGFPSQGWYALEQGSSVSSDDEDCIVGTGKIIL